MSDDQVIDAETPLTDREILEGILDELAGIRAVLVSHLLMQTLPPMVRDTVKIDEDGNITIPPTYPPMNADDADRAAIRRAKFQAAVKGGQP